MARNDSHLNGNGADAGQNAAEFPPNPTIRIVPMDESGLREWLAQLKGSTGFIADLAPQLGVSPQLLGDVLAGRKGFGPKLLRGLKEYGVVRDYRMFDVEIVMDGGNSE